MDNGCALPATPLAPALALLGGEYGRERRSAHERLVDDAVALREPLQRRELLLVRIGFQLEEEPDRPETDWRVAVDCERAAEVQLSLRSDPAGSDLDPERCGD